MSADAIRGVKDRVTSVKLVQAALRAVAYFRCRFFDWKHGVDTCGITLWQNDTTPHIQYAATHPKIVPEMLVPLDIDYRNYVFIDFGSGKGRVILLASEFPFKRVVGVESSEELHRIAAKNIKCYRAANQRCFDIESVNDDARFYKIPSEPAVLYFFNPFGQEVMSQVLQNIRESLDTHPRDIIIIYLSPRFSDLVMQLKGIQRLKQTRYYSVYRFSPSARIMKCN